MWFILVSHFTLYLHAPPQFRQDLQAISSLAEKDRELFLIEISNLSGEKC